MSDRANQLFVFSTVDSNDAARRLADGLVDAQLAACVNILPPITSVFRWEPDSADAGSAAVQAESEVMLIAKTSAAAYPELEAQLRREHPYDLPEIVAIPVSRGLPEFLQWIDAATSRA
jgi:periplasmic divalent cation tolerance protein